EEKEVESAAAAPEQEPEEEKEKKTEKDEKEREDDVVAAVADTEGSSNANDHMEQDGSDIKSPSSAPIAVSTEKEEAPQVEPTSASTNGDSKLKADARTSSPEANPTSRLKRGAKAIATGEQDTEPTAKKPKLGEDSDDVQPQAEDSSQVVPATAESTSQKADSDEDMAASTYAGLFSLTSGTACDFGSYVEDGFWMDAIKTHCFVTYPDAETVATSGESKKVPDVSKTKNNGEGDAAPRQKAVTIDEFFLKTETKPVLYYLPLTDEQIQQRKQRKQQQQQEGPPRRRRHRGGRKRNKRGGRRWR
ncbi:hypothetical protein BBJ28_00020973, partial [Nothophytophthora sp. Chile5]